MAIKVHIFPCPDDNYTFLCREEASGLVACTDTPDAEVILRERRRLAGRLIALPPTPRPRR